MRRSAETGRPGLVRRRARSARSRRPPRGSLVPRPIASTGSRSGRRLGRARVSPLPARLSSRRGTTAPRGPATANWSSRRPVPRARSRIARQGRDATSHRRRAGVAPGPPGDAPSIDGAPAGQRCPPAVGDARPCPLRTCATPRRASALWPGGSRQTTATLTYCANDSACRTNTMTSSWQIQDPRTVVLTNDRQVS